MYGNKLKKSDNQKVEHAPSTSTCGVGPAFQFEDNRSQAVYQRKLQGLADSLVVKQALANNPVAQRVDDPTKKAETKLTPEAIAVREQEVNQDLNGAKIWAEAIFSGGLVYKKTGAVDGRKAKAELVNGKVIFAYGNGQIYIRSEPHGQPRPDGFTHANFLSGAAVKTAGQMFIRDGVITRLDNESGHYKPGSTTLEWALQKLSSVGVDLTRILLVMDDGHDMVSYNASDYFYTESIEDVTELDDQVRLDDEDYQKTLDAMPVGADTVRFDFFGWPYSKLRRNEWGPKITILKSFVAKRGRAHVEIVFSTTDNKIISGELKTKAAAKDIVRRLLSDEGLVEAPVVDYVHIQGDKAYLQFTVVR